MPKAEVLKALRTAPAKAKKSKIQAADGTSAPPEIPTKRYQPIAPAFLVPQSSVTMRSLVFGLVKKTGFR